MLLVDDDIRNVFALSNLLEGLGMQVAFAETGRQALELLDREIGETIGMANMGHFYKIFRKFNHCSPKEFREKQLQWGRE